MNITYIRAMKDVNGNPRRGWTIRTPKGLVFIDEGFAGHSALYEWLGEAMPHEGCKCPDHNSCIWDIGHEIFWGHVNETWKSVSVREYEYAKYEYAFQLVNS